MVVAPVVHPRIGTAARPAEGLWPLLEEERLEPLLAATLDLEHALVFLGLLDDDVAPARALSVFAVRPFPSNQL